MAQTNDQGFKVAKLEDRIAPSSGVVVAENLFNGSGNDAGHVSNAGNLSNLGNGNTALADNAATTANNAVGNALFNG